MLLDDVSRLISRPSRPHRAGVQGLSTLTELDYQILGQAWEVMREVEAIWDRFSFMCNDSPIIIRELVDLRGPEFVKAGLLALQGREECDHPHHQMGPTRKAAMLYAILHHLRTCTECKATGKWADHLQREPGWDLPDGPLPDVASVPLADRAEVLKNIIAHTMENLGIPGKVHGLVIGANLQEEKLLKAQLPGEFFRMSAQPGDASRMSSDDLARWTPKKGQES